LRSSDRRLSLLHFIAQTVTDKFPELVHFDTELQAVDRASLGKTTVALVHCIAEHTSSNTTTTTVSTKCTVILKWKIYF